MSLHFPRRVPANDKNIPLIQRHWLTPEYRARLGKKFSINTPKQLETKNKLEEELALIAQHKKILI